MKRPFAIACSILAASFAMQAEQATVRVEPTNLQGPRPLAKQTETAVIRDYLQAWQSLGTALDQNRVSMLDQAFVGTAKDKLTETIQEQTKLGVRTHYQDRAHDIQIVFYSPEGLSVQLLDTAEYDVQILDQGKVQTTQHVRERYVVVLTPAETRWRVRIFQGEPGDASSDSKTVKAGQ
jgi:hypothetical protein